MALVDVLPLLKIEIDEFIRGKPQNKNQDICAKLFDLERQFQEKLQIWENQQLVELKVIGPGEDRNEQFDDFFEDEILKNENESDIAACYNDIERAIRVVFSWNGKGNSVG